MKKRIFLIILIVIVLLGALLRANYMLVPGTSATRISPDEAVYGIEAIHILKGERPAFFYAQPYTGSGSAYLSAGLFALTGISDIALKIVPFIFSLFIIVIEYFLAKRIFKSEKCGLFAALFTALGSPFWLNWSSRAGTGYIEMMVFGGLIFLLTLKIVFDKDYSRRTFFLLGLCAGVGFWVQPTIAYYLLPSGLLIFFSNPKILFNRNFYFSVFGALIGASPVIYYNLISHNTTSQALFNKPWGIKPALYKFFTDGLPVVFGTRPPWSTTDFFMPLSIIVYIIYLAGFVVILKDRLPKIIKRNFEPIDLIVIFFFSLLFIFSLSSPFNQFVIEPRYIQALYTGLPFVVLYLVRKYWDVRGKLLFVIPSVIVIMALVGIVKTPPSSFVDGYSFYPVVDYLNSKGIKYVFSDAASAHRLTFAAKEKIIAAPMEGGITSARLPYYEQMVKDKDCNDRGAVFLQNAPAGESLMQEMKNCKIPLDEEIFGNAIMVVTPRR